MDEIRSQGEQNVRAFHLDKGNEGGERPSGYAEHTSHPAQFRAEPQKTKLLVEPKKSKPWLRWGLFAILPIVLVIATYWYVTGGKTVSTDDAYINAEKVGISTDVSGTIMEIDVHENETVAAGSVLFRLDPRQFEIALQNAKSNLAQVELTLNSMKVDYKRMLSDAAAQQAQVDLDQMTFDRSAKLLPSGAVAQTVYDQARFTLMADKNKLGSLQQQAQVQIAKLGGNIDTPTSALPQYKQAQAQVDEAQRELDHTIVKAPFSGTVTNVPTIAPGKYLQASTTAFYLVDANHLWVDCQPKETELTYVKSGQKTTITVDAYPDVQWTGTVESISPAASQEFSLLPAENTSGNWVKVVQRVPMRVRIDQQPGTPPLRAGMSAVVDVDTGHARGLPHFITSWF